MHFLSSIKHLSLNARYRCCEAARVPHDYVQHQVRRPYDFTRGKIEHAVVRLFPFALLIEGQLEKF